MPSSSVARWLRRDGVVRCREGFHSAGTRAVVPMVVLHGLGRLGYLPFASIAPPRLDPFAHDQRQHPQRGDRIGPPPAERRIQPQTEKSRRREPRADDGLMRIGSRSEEHTSELQSLAYLVCRLLLEKKKKTKHTPATV